MGKYRIETAPTYGPTSEQWCACFGDQDVDTKYGTGATEDEAIRDLLDNHDCPWDAK